jgi:hypothetical protein
LRTVDELIDHCQGAYADSTLRNYRADLRAFAAWCALEGRSWLPADADTVAAFLTADVETVAIARPPAPE